jgi:hypothetical protein
MFDPVVDGPQDIGGVLDVANGQTLVDGHGVEILVVVELCLSGLAAVGVLMA